MTMKASPDRPKDVQGKVAVVDAANVAIDDATGQASIERLKLLKAALEATGCSQVIFIADARLRHRLAPADLDQFKGMIESRELYQSPAGTSADQFVIDLAKRKDGFMVSNDRYREHAARWTELQSRLIKFLIVENDVFLSGVDPAPESERATGAGEESIASVIEGQSSSWFDVFVTVPFVSIFGGFFTAAIWILALAAMFAPLYAFEASPLGLLLFGAALVVAGSIAVLLTLRIARWFVRDVAVSGSNVNEVYLRAYTAVALVLWMAGLALLVTAVVLDTAWPLIAGFVLSIGPVFPLVGFIRATKLFRDFTQGLDTALVISVCLAAIAWLSAELVYALRLRSSEIEGVDRFLVSVVLTLLVVQATAVLWRWAAPVSADS